MVEKNLTQEIHLTAVVKDSPVFPLREVYSIREGSPHPPVETPVESETTEKKLLIVFAILLDALTTSKNVSFGQDKHKPVSNTFLSSKRCNKTTGYHRQTFRPQNLPNILFRRMKALVVCKKAFDAKSRRRSVQIGFLIEKWFLRKVK